MLIRRLSAVSITSGLSVESGPMLSGGAPMARAEEDVDVDSDDEQAEKAAVKVGIETRSHKQPQCKRHMFA